MDRLRLSSRISYRPIEPHFMKLALQIDSFVAVDPTTDVKIRIYHFEGEKGQCRSFEVLHPCKYLHQFMDKYTITSITKDIYRNETTTKNFAQPLFLSGWRLALDTKLGINILSSVNVCLTMPLLRRSTVVREQNFSS